MTMLWPKVKGCIGILGDTRTESLLVKEIAGRLEEERAANIVVSGRIITFTGGPLGPTGMSMVGRGKIWVMLEEGKVAIRYEVSWLRSLLCALAVISVLYAVMALMRGPKAVPTYAWFTGLGMAMMIAYTSAKGHVTRLLRASIRRVGQSPQKSE